MLAMLVNKSKLQPKDVLFVFWGASALNIPLSGQLSTKKRHILVVTHNVADEFKGGGIEVYQEYIRNINEYDVSFLSPVRQEGQTFWRFHYKNKNIIDQKLEKKNTGSCNRDPIREKLFKNLLERFNFDLIHFQHLMGAPLSLPLIAKSKKIPMIYTLHDFFLVCQKYTLIGIDNRFCDIFNDSLRQCDFCLRATRKKPFGTQEQRRRAVKKSLDAMDVIISNTEFTQSAFKKIYPDLPTEKFRILEMLAPHQERPSIPKFLPRSIGDPLKVVVPGNFSILKGADTILRLIAGLANTNIHFKIIGKAEKGRIRDTIQKIVSDKIEYLDGYAPDESVTLMSDQDISLHLSVLPETYMITLSEAWLSGTIPIVSNLGAPADRVVDGINGFVVPPYSLGKISDILRMMASDTSKLNQMRAATQKVQIASPKTHLANLLALYETLLSTHSRQYLQH